MFLQGKSQKVEREYTRIKKQIKKLGNKTASIKVTAKRIVWGKFINCGQTCIAPDFLIVNKRIKQKLTLEIINQIKILYGKNPQKS